MAYYADYRGKADINMNFGSNDFYPFYSILADS